MQPEQQQPDTFVEETANLPTWETTEILHLHKLPLKNNGNAFPTTEAITLSSLFPKLIFQE